jgi:hypothetical protein
MSQQYSVTLRNALLEVFTAQYGNTPHIEIWSGAIPASVATASSGTKLAKFDIAGNVGTYDTAAASGVKEILKASSLPLATTGLANGTAGYYRVFKSDDTTCVEQGTVTATGGGGDATIDSLNITLAQPVQITGFNKTAPGA